MTNAATIRTAALLVLVICAAPLALRAQGESRHLTEASWSPRGDRAALLFSLSNGSGSSPGYELWLLEGPAVLRAERFETESAHLVGWTAAGDAAILDQGPGTIRLVPLRGEASDRIRLPQAAVCLGSDGRQAFFLSDDRRHLLAADRHGQTRVVATLPPGVRPPGALSLDGRMLALRRSVRRGSGPRAHWATEIWVVEDGQAARAVTVEGPMVRVAWHPDRPALLLSSPSPADSWSSRVVERRGSEWEVAGEHPRLPSPMQWDRSGRMYAADARGLLEVGREPRRVRDWAPGAGRLMFWAVSPAGGQVLAGLEDGGDGSTQVVLFPLPSGEGIPLQAAHGASEAR